MTKTLYIHAVWYGAHILTLATSHNKLHFSSLRYLRFPDDTSDRFIDWYTYGNLIQGMSTTKASNGEEWPINPPSLDEILSDISLPPWNRGAFMAYLSQHHCIETLEFLLDTENYTLFYDQLITGSPMSRDREDRVNSSWGRLIRLYIAPCGPRQVNISGRERNHLLNILGGSRPPHPSELDKSRRAIYNLVNESLLAPFFESVIPIQRQASPLEYSRSSHTLHQISIGCSMGLPPSTSSRPAIACNNGVDDGEGNSVVSKLVICGSLGCFHHTLAVCKRYWRRARHHASSHP